ncbi:hypothetical protein BLS_001092 [Venturia inaequalis]|uniref:Kinetochore protein fta4 n=1 Tax=Venturia inaequalis TaxID=5025 RepID=A0A8H3U481_VENIN|nr:hypothetical protein BLS_001092 [Venturia inaequalis]
MVENADPILALKTTFLRQQVRVLSQPLRPSERWKKGSDLPEEEVGIAVKRANDIVRRHNNSVYDGIAIRNLATQIDRLYWKSTNPEDPLYDEDVDAVSRQGDDFTRDDNIAKLSSMVEGEEGVSEDLQLQIQSLQELQLRRAELQKKLSSYRHLQSLMEPFKDPQNSIQPNLVTRDGPLADELAKSKALGIRVAGRLTGLEELDGRGDDEDDDLMMEEDEKLAAVLGSS